MGNFYRGAVAGVLTACALAAPAGAQERYQQVAGPALRGSTLGARADGRHLCMVLKSGRSEGHFCAERPALDEPGFTDSRSGGISAVGGAVVARTARVEVEWADGTRTTAVTGDAHGVRYFVADRRGSAPFLLRQFDTGGALVGATAIDQVHAAVGPRQPIGVSRVAGRPWLVEGYFARAHVPLPGAIDHSEIAPCLHIDFEGRTRQCFEPEPLLRDPVAPALRRLDAGSPPASRAPFGFIALLGPGAAGAVAHLGDGTRLSLPVRNLPSPSGETVGYVARVLPRRQAIRRVEILDTAGAVTATLAYGAPPAFLRGDQHGYATPARPPLPTPAVAARTAAGTELRTGDVGEARLCVGLPPAANAEQSCGTPPVDPMDSLIVGGGLGEELVVGGVVPAEVAQVEVRERRSPWLLPGTEPATVRVTPEPADAFPGRWRGKVRSFIAPVPHGGNVDVQLLGADGRDLGTFSHVAVFFNLPPGGDRPRTFLQRHGLRLAQDDFGCVVHLDRVAKNRLEACSYGENVVDVLVSCDARATAVVLPTRGRRDLRIRTARGGAVRPERRRLGDTPLAVAILPRGSAPRAVTWRGGRIRLDRVPPASRQCGYRHTVHVRAAHRPGPRARARPRPRRGIG